ncbi:MAG: hypothetical protein HYT72_02940 [Candidatus Aenigmarchaeota archaeon]|nr:hypothetical protein [Candidatus Aenigmarchaeota archaeon]
MHPAVKLVIGLLVFTAGVYWYAGPLLGQFNDILGIRPTRAFMDMFVGLFGIFLIFIGLIVAWIEYEDLKWEKKEKKK